MLDLRIRIPMLRREVTRGPPGPPIDADAPRPRSTGSSRPRASRRIGTAAQDARSRASGASIAGELDMAHVSPMLGQMGTERLQSFHGVGERAPRCVGELVGLSFDFDQVRLELLPLV